LRRRAPMTVLFVFFFFQAEDGIRDRNVTGVQTCALPISSPTTAPKISACKSASVKSNALSASGFSQAVISTDAGSTGNGLTINSKGTTPAQVSPCSTTRSEERRVGKECRYRRGTYRDKKK